jgi:Phage tail lysozyme
LASIGVALNDDNGEMRKAVDIYADVAKQFENLSQAQRNMVAEGLAGKYHISRMTALLSNWDLYEKQLTDSINSKNSAMNENSTYMQSMSAKIELLKHGFETLALAIGNAFLSDGFVGIVKGLTDLAKVGAWVANTIGALPVIFATAGMSAIVFSGRIKALVLQSELATIAFTKLGIASKKMQLALATTVVGAGLVGIGIILESLIGKYSEYQRKQEEAQQQIERYNKASQDTYLNENDKLEKLIKSYKSYSEAKEQGALTSEEEKEYLKVQSELASIFPNLISYIDSKGQAHLREVSEIENVIDSTREMIQLKKDEIALDAQSSLNKRQDEVSDIKDQISSKKDDLETYQNLAETHILKGQRESAKKEANQLEQELVLLRNRLSIAEKGINKEVLKISDAFTNLDLKVNPKVAKDVSDLIADLDFSKLNTTELELASKQISESMEKISGSAEKGNQESFSKNVNTLVKDLQSLGVEGGSLQDFSIPFDKARDSLYLASNSANQATNEIDRLNLASEEGIGTTSEAAKVYDIFGNEVAKAGDELSEIEKLQLAMVGATSASTEEVQQLINSYMVLSEQTVKTAEQEKYLAEVTEKLGSIYPHLVDGKKINIKAMAEEHKSMKIMLDATEKFANGQMDAQEAMVYASASATQARINMMKEEIKALMAFITAYETAVPTDIYGNQLADNRAQRKYDYSTDKLARLQEALNSLNVEFNAQAINLGELTGYTDDYTGSKDKNKKSTDKQNKAQEALNRTLEKYSQLIEKIDVRLKSINSLKSKYTQGSRLYRNAVQKEIDLLKEKQKLIESEQRALAKLPKTQTYTSSSGGSSYSSSSVSSMASGNSNSDKIWNYFKSKGFSDSVVAGIMGNLKMESNLNTNALNKSSGAFGLAQWLGSRKSALSNYANSRGTSMSNLSTQLDFLWKELNSTEKRTLNYLKSNQNASASQIAAAFDRLFERSEGTHIPQRQKYANQFLSQFAGKSVSVSASGSSSGGSTTKVEDITNEINSAINGNKNELTDIADQISELLFEIIRDMGREFDKKAESIDRKMQESQNRNQFKDETSSSYRQELNHQIALLKQKRALQLEEILYYERQLKNNKNLTTAQKAELQAMIAEGRSAVSDMTTSITEISLQRINSEIDELVKSLDAAYDKISETVDKINKEIGRLDQDDANYSEKQIELIEKRLKFLQEEKATAISNIAKLTQKLNELKKSNATADEIEKVNGELEKWKDNLEGIEETILDSQDELKEVYNTIADEIIEKYKEMYEKQKDIQLDAIDDEIDALEKAHKEKMDLLDEELSKLQEITQAKIDAIDRQESVDDYNKEVVKRQEEIQKIQNKINQYGLDDSRGAQAEKERLEEELKLKKEELEEFKHDREIEERKRALQEDLKNKEKDTETQKENDESVFDNEKQRLEDSKEQWEKYYDNLVNDERAFAQIREDVLAGNFEAIAAQLQNFTDFASEHMTEIGESITQNLLDQIAKLQDAIDGIEGSTYLPKENNRPGTLNSQDFKLMGAKFMTGYLKGEALKSGDSKAASELSAMGTDWGKEARKNGANLDPYNTMSYDDVVKNLTADEKVMFAKYLQNTVLPQVSGNKDLSTKVQSYITKLMGTGQSEGSGISSDSSFATDFNAYNPDNNKREYGKLNKGDIQVALAKYLKTNFYDSLKNPEEKGIVNKLANQLSENGRAAGSKIDPYNELSFAQIWQQFTPDEKVLAAKYLREVLSPTIEGSHLRGLMMNSAYGIAKSARTSGATLGSGLSFEDALSKYLSLDTGGMTSSWGNQGKFAMLHEKEIVLNKGDSKNFLDAIKFTRDLFLNIPKFKMPNMIQPQESTEGGNIYMDVHIDKVEGGKAGADTFFKEINNTFKSKGIRPRFG